MKAWLPMILCVLPAGGAWASVLDVLPGEASRPALITLDYEQPWSGLDVSRGRAAAGLPLPGDLWVGARAARTSAPTVHETGFGAWLGWRRFLFLAVDRTELAVSGLEPEGRVDAELALRLSAGPVAWGWSTRGEGIDQEPSVWWREWWLSLRGAGVEVVAGRRLTPWADVPLWTLGLRLSLPGAVEAGMRWRGESSTLALRWTVSGAQLTAATVWSGPDAGGIGLRLRAGEH